MSHESGSVRDDVSQSAPVEHQESPPSGPDGHPASHILNPPTGEELRNIKDATELYRSTSFKLQVRSSLVHNHFSPSPHTPSSDRRSSPQCSPKVPSLSTTRQLPPLSAQVYHGSALHSPPTSSSRFPYPLPKWRCCTLYSAASNGRY